MTYRAESWSKARRVVLVVLERPGELLLDRFWLITSLDAETVPAAELLELYRERGRAEGHMGKLMGVLEPALSSAPRTKRHYRGRREQNVITGGAGFRNARARSMPSPTTRPFSCSTSSPTKWFMPAGVGWSRRPSKGVEPAPFPPRASCTPPPGSSSPAAASP